MIMCILGHLLVGLVCITWLLSFMEAQKMGLTNIWLERDSALVCVVFTARTNVSWLLRNRRNTCLNSCGKIRFR